MHDDDLKLLETRLRSWQPRRPSRTFNLRLAMASGLFIHRAARFAGVLVPAAACVLLAVLNLNSGNVYGLGHSSEITPAFSNQNYAAWMAGDGKKGENCPPGQIFKWTNGETSPSSMRFNSSGE